jgi:ribosomal protein S4
MILKKKTKFKPLYKKFFKLKENVQNRQKLLNFKKKKWEIIIKKYKQSLKWYKQFKPKNQNQYIVSKFPNRGTSYKQRYRDTLITLKRLELFYGGFVRKVIKKQVNNQIKKNYKNNTKIFIESFEKRLDVILYRAKFCPSMRNAQQLIVHGKVLVNNKEIKIKSYKLRPSDLISIKPKFYKLIENNIQSAQIWPIPPKHLIVNYKTMQIIFGDIKHINLSTMFSFHLKLEKILNKFI